MRLPVKTNQSKNMLAFICLCLIAGLQISVQAQTSPGTPETSDSSGKQKVSSIDEVRAIVKTINDGWATKRFRTLERSFADCGDTFTEFRRLTRDQNGVVRRYELSYTAEDEGRTDQYYYDESGRLRFVLISGSAGNGSRLRHRIFFDRYGKRLREQHNVTGGVGHYWPRTWPVKELLKNDAARDFANTSRCTKQIHNKQSA